MTRDNTPFWAIEAIGEARDKKLHSLDLSNHFARKGEKLNCIPSSVFELKHLKSLDLGGNGLTEIPEAVAQFTHLRNLDLHGNQLIFLTDAITRLANLEHLDVHGNRLRTVPLAIEQLNRLQVLDLSRNQLTALPSTLVDLTHLHTLDLSVNQLTAVPAWLLELPKLETLYLYGNPIIIPPPEVVKFDGYNPVNLNNLFTFFQQLETAGNARLYEAKLLIVGEPGAGKTSLTRKLLDPDAPLPDKDESTKGIGVYKWIFPVSVNGNQIVEDQSHLLAKGKRTSERKPLAEHCDFRVNIWDFGGQEIYHATHQFFLTRRSLYVVVADAREQKTDFFHWLDLIEHLSDRSPVLIFNNEIQNIQWAINEQQLHKHFPDIFHKPIAFNLADNTQGLKHLLMQIKRTVIALPHIGDMLPRTWVDVRQKLEEDDHFYISWDTFSNLCEASGFIDLASKLQLSGYLHDLGVILHYQDEPLLKRTVILKPEWATDAVYRVLESEVVRVKHGQFNRTDLQQIWKEKKYDMMHDELLALMMKFKLCYELPVKKGQYIAPQLLREQPPSYPWDDANNIHLRYKYDTFMPKGLLARFIVEMHSYIAEQDEQELVWRSGVILEKDGVRAEVVESYYRREIRIRVTGKNRRDWLSNIAYELEKFHSPYHRLKFDKQIPCNCQTCRTCDDPFFYNLIDLKIRLDHNRPTIECNKPPFCQVNIRSLIDDVGGYWSSSVDLAALRRQLAEAFSSEETKTLCADLGVEFDDLPAKGRVNKLRELISLMQRTGRLDELIMVVKKQRPTISFF